MRKIDILGTKYTVETLKRDKDEYLLSHETVGAYCDFAERKIVCSDLSEYEHLNMDGKTRLHKRLLRHEIVHAFLNESGLADNSATFYEPWVANEEMIDWFAIQSPKIFEVYNKLGVL